MKQVINMTILILLMGIPKIGNCAEFGSWWQKTPGNNEIANEKWRDNYIIGINCKDLRMKQKYHGDIMRNDSGNVISSLTKWHFYKNQIIGEFNNKGKKGYFIFNESTCQKEVFEEELKFKNKLKALNLKPKIWTRWYKSNWGIIFTSGAFEEGFIFLFIKLPILIILSLTFLIGLVKTKFNFKHKFNVISSAAFLLVIARILLDFLPSSI